VVKVILLVVGILVIGALAALADAYYQSYRIYKDVRGIPTQLTAVRRQLSLGEVPADDRLVTLSTEVATARRTAEGRFSMKVSRLIPFLNRPVVAVDRGLDAADEETQAATAMRDIVRDALGDVATQKTPFAPASKTPIFHEGKVNVALLADLTPRLEAVARHLQAADRAIQDIPSVPFVDQLESLKADATKESAQALALITDALDGARLLPSFLGAERPTTYFLAMQNNADQRATGGAVLAYAFVTIDEGELKLESGGSVYDLDQKEGFKGVDVPPEIAWYADNVTGRSPRLANLNYSPDFPVVAQAWAAILKKATGKNIDGAIAIDPVAVSYILGKRKITIPSYDKPITENNIVKVVENDQYRLSYADQKVFPAQLIGQAWKILKDPTPFVRTLKQLGLAIRQKHLQIWSAQADQQALLERLGWDNGLRVGDGDFVYVTDNKRSANKVDYYTHVSIDYAVQIDARGEAHATCQVTIENDTPPSESRFIVGPKKGLNTALIGLLAPEGATLESAEPADGPPDHTEAGAKTFLRTVEVPAGGEEVVQFTYTIPNVVLTEASGKRYQLTIQHQPLANPVQMSVTVTLPLGTTILSAPGWNVDGNVATFHTQLTQDTVREIQF
jgi:hypothetical protein